MTETKTTTTTENNNDFDNGVGWPEISLPLPMRRSDATVVITRVTRVIRLIRLPSSPGNARCATKASYGTGPRSRTCVTHATVPKPGAVLSVTLGRSERRRPSSTRCVQPVTWTPSGPSVTPRARRAHPSALTTFADHLAVKPVLNAKPSSHHEQGLDDKPSDECA